MATNPTDNDNMNTDNFSDELTPSDRTGVSFAAAVDNEEPPYRKKSSQELRAAKARQSLSASAKQWDLDGDGELDDAEMALRNLDKSHKGTLSKEQMYELMADNLQTQRQLFKVKKVVIGLVAFTCFLALCNLGTSFAAAFLAKDTTTANGKFVDTHTGNTLKTDSSATTFNIDKELTDAATRQRRLQCVAARRLAKPGSGTTDPTDYDCTVAANAVTMEIGAAIVDGCDAGGTMKVIKEFTTGPGPDHTVCQLGTGYSVTYGQINAGQGNKYPTMRVVYNNEEVITILPNADNSLYEITGLYSHGTERCDSTADCATDLTCDIDPNDPNNKVCTEPPAAEEATTTTTTTTTTQPPPTTTTTTLTCDGSLSGTSCGAIGDTCSWTESCSDGSTPSGNCDCLQPEIVGGKIAWSCAIPMCLPAEELPALPEGDAAQAPGDGDQCPTNGDACPDGKTCYSGYCGYCQTSDDAGCNWPNPTCVGTGNGIGYCSCDGDSDCTDNASGGTGYSCGAGTLCGTENWCSTDHDNDTENPCWPFPDTTTVPTKL